MQERNCQAYLVVACCTGVIVTIVWTGLLFWVCTIPRIVIREHASATAVISPSGFFSNEPNRTEQPGSIKSLIQAGLHHQSVESHLGILDIQETLPGSEIRGDAWKFSDPNHATVPAQPVFDRRRGVWSLVYLTREGGGSRPWRRKVALYAGPKGMARTYTTELGRFSQKESLCYYPAREPKTMIYYDGSLRQLFRLDFREQRVIAGTVLSEYDRALQIGHVLWKNPILIDGPRIVPPRLSQSSQELGKRTGEEAEKSSGSAGTVFRVGTILDPPLLLTWVGGIHELDLQTAQLKTRLGHYPELSADVGGRLLAYTVSSVTIDNRTAGILAATLSGDGKKIYLYVNRADQEARVAAGRAEFPEDLWQYSPYLAMRVGEVLHPYTLSLLSRWVAPRINALAGSRAFFVVPHSRPMQGYLDPRSDALTRELRFIGGIIPQFALGVLVGLRLRRVTRQRGMKRSICEGWLLAGVVVGIPAYITYYLTRSRVPMITCHNCGQNRRSDQQHCHHCKSGETPASQVPAWRVLETA